MEFLTYDDYRVFGNIKQPTVDPEVDQLIKSANAFITSYLNIETAPVTNIQVNQNRDTYFLDAIAATGITSITRFGSSEPVDPSLYFLQSPGVLVFLSIPPAGWYAVSTVTNGTPTVTDDLKNAAFMLVMYWKKNEYRDSKSFGGETVAFTNQSTGVPKHIRTILELYRNI